MKTLPPRKSARLRPAQFNLGAVKRWLRSPRLILAEIVALAVAGAIGGLLPQAGVATVEELARWHSAPAFTLALMDAFALDHVFQSAWFSALALLTALTLATVLAGQFRRLRIAWRQQPDAATFRTAPFRVEFWRPAEAGREATQSRCWTEGKIGLAGSTWLHLGLLCIIVAGAWRALFGAQAVVDLLEGETLPPDPAAWAAQWTGPLARPVQVASTVSLRSIIPSYYAPGELRALEARVQVTGQGASQELGLKVNRDLRLPGGRLFLGTDFGPAVLAEWHLPGGATARNAALLAGQGGGVFEGLSQSPEGLRAWLRAAIREDGRRPESVEVRVMHGSALLLAANVHAGETIVLPGGGTLAVQGLPFWARLRAHRDSALWLAYCGFAFVMVGVILIFAIVKVDGCVLVTPEPGGERIFVALKPQRLAPLFQERFAQLVRRHGGPVEASGEPDTATPIRAARITSAPTGRWARRSVWFPAAASAALVSVVIWRAWPQPGLDRARQLVERYNQVVSEAYRRGDVKLIDPVVGPAEGRKITGLIGVRTDFGLTLDSRLLSLEVTGTEQRGDELRVRTRERWLYRDLRIGSGRLVGEKSLDAYEMLYVFKKNGRAWLADEIQFAAEPLVGRKQTPWLAAGHGASAPGTPGLGREDRAP